jgi:hypothetical protein
MLPLHARITLELDRELPEIVCSDACVASDPLLLAITSSAVQRLTGLHCMRTLQPVLSSLP